uniref:Uncharacterized protein n=1 Tax=Setaria italica TaxID=4555 RepID=K4AH99_SETIT
MRSLTVSRLQEQDDKPQSRAAHVAFSACRRVQVCVYRRRMLPPELLACYVQITQIPPGVCVRNIPLSCTFVGVNTLLVQDLRVKFRCT